jgi:hypothetical protein
MLLSQVISTLTIRFFYEDVFPLLYAFWHIFTAFVEYLYLKIALSSHIRTVNFNEAQNCRETAVKERDER